RTLADDVGCHRRVPDPQVGANGRDDHEYPLGERFRQDDDVLVQGTWWVETPRRCNVPTFSMRGEITPRRPSSPGSPACPHSRTAHNAAAACSPGHTGPAQPP